jgi:antitoxin component YwqK of YwqJK toxin-antitoxin module
MLYATNGNLIERGKYMDGQKHGKWINWTADGVKTGEVKFEQGQRDGKWQIWDESGVLRYVMFYEVGEKVGNWKIYADNGDLLQEKDYTKSL